MSQPQDKFDLWCVVELFGHSKIAGRCTEQNIAGTNMLRVDVPETESQPSFTRLLGSAAIYAINPVDEGTARHYAQKLSIKPIESWDISEFMKKHAQHQLAATASPEERNFSPELEDDYDDDNGGTF